MIKESLSSRLASHLRLAASLSLMLVFAACSSTKEGEPPFGANGTAGGESIYDGNVLPTRDESMNPDNADYQTLAQYTIYFTTDGFTIDPAERAKAEAVAKWLQDNPSAKIVVAGHCDDRGTTQYNLALGERRSLAVREYLIGLGTTKERASTVSYGEEKPAVQGNNEEAWAKNRRAQIGVFR